MHVIVVPPDPTWPQQFADEAQRLKGALGDVMVDIHHIGSTSIYGIHAKPIIDILMVVDDHDALDARTASLEALGYEAMGEFGIEGRRYFRRMNADGTRTHHIHAFESGSSEILRHLAFRDYMNAHKEAAREYSKLKQRLAIQFQHDIEAYMDGKDSFIKRHQELANRWNTNRG
jgi:GrpB-like predicted nucleotidyltransferase (UPF0157 family)